ncbi:MAG TPA: methionyl-tRNA formyltransferase [bacterium]|nr:methionyl-tRNA formyltransferase [bacterium]
MRWFYFGTPQYAATILTRLLAAGHVPELVVTQPDRPAGRRRQLTPPPVKEVALAHGLPVLQPEKITHQVREELAARKPDVIVVAAYGKILRPAMLAVPPHGCINAHASLLPHYRGAAPVNWMLVNGETQTGVTIIKMDAGIDTGPVLAERAIPIAPDDNAGTLLVKLAELAGDLLVETLPRYLAGEIQSQPQPEEGSYAPMLRKEDGLLDWTQTATALVNRVRGMTPWPGAYTFWQGKTIKILQAEPVAGHGAPGEVLQAKKDLLVAAGEGAVALRQLQMQGKKEMPAAAFLNGVPLAVGDTFGPKP